MILTAISGYSLTREVRSEQSYLVTVVWLRAFIVKVRGLRSMSPISPNIVPG